MDNKGEMSLIHKAERVASAVHLVTDFVPESEAVRVRIRLTSLNLLSDIVTSSSKIRQTVLELISLVSIGRQIGFISDMNALLLSAELFRLEGLVKVRGPELKDSLFLADPRENPESYKKTLSSRAIKDRPHKKAGLSAVREASRSSRRESLLALLRKGAPITVKDALAAVPGVSEKTLQRELIALVRDGVLKREGERRWSRYSLV